MKINEFTKVAKVLAREYKINVEEGRSWASNIKKRDVFYVKNDVNTLSEDHLLGLLLHEIAHIHYTSDVKIPDKNKELTQITLNMIEDISIEYIISKDYPNAGEILESTKSEVLDTLVKMLPKAKGITEYEKALLYAAARFEGRGYKFGIAGYEMLGQKISEIMLKHEDEIYERKATKDLMPLVNEIIDLIIKEIGEPSDYDKNEMSKDGMHGHSDKEEQADANGGNPGGRGTNDPSAKEQLINALKGGNGWKGNLDHFDKAEFINEISDQASMIGKQLRTVLKRNNAMEFGGRYRTGKLISKRLVRIKVLKDRRPFTRRIIKSNQSYAFAVAADVSGSMFNRSPKESAGSYALTSLHMVGEALRQAGIPRSLIIFGDKANVIAPITKKSVGWEELSNSKSIYKAKPGGTQIHEAMNACIKELKKVRAERKIMIILTDGSSDRYAMQDAHKKAVQEGIEPLAIEISSMWSGSCLDETFSEKKNIKITDTGQPMLIGKAFIDILKNSITKG